jgi:D-alanyl-lipoteichoic acid acyltransferase DltB (MBOAT superfamily)
MEFVSFPFIGLALTAVTALRLCGARWQREIVLGLANLAFLASFVVEARELAPLLSFLALGYAAVHLARRASHVALCAIIVAVVLIFIWLKQYFALLPSLGFAYLTVGLSYILFRVLHLVIDVAQGESKAPGALTYFGYATCFLTFVSGPIQRFQDFEEQMEKPPVVPTQTELNRAAVVWESSILSVSRFAPAPAQRFFTTDRCFISRNTSTSAPYKQPGTSSV